MTDPDPYGGHEFAYEPHTDLFRCVRCHVYEVNYLATDQPGEPCSGQLPPGAEPITVNLF